MLATPAVCGLVSIAVVVADEALGLPASTVVLAALSLGLLIVRLGVAFMENSALLFVKHQESTTDALTALGNRRALLIDLELGAADGAEPGLLMIFDLDGFKRYNDSFGHPAGDALLQRLAVRLAEAAAGLGGLAYRLGGDEFCVLAPTLGRDTEEMTLRACSALRERGDGFEITSSWGAAELPCAGGREQALKVADRRMYALKNGTRPTAAQQSLDVLLATVRERHPDLGDHVDGVAEMAVDTARRLGLDDGEIERIRLAAELHDIGKLGIPDAILHKPGALDATEWEFMRRHTLIGERILHAAPDLHDVAPIVRSTHERWDGAGYPDALAGEAIPLGARVVAVCDAFDAMISHRSYSESISPGAATAELARCAGSQFDPAVVGCFTAMIEQRRELLPAAVPGGSQAALLR
jgi:diguanylate cyclase (GGDEF)-like protein